MPCDDPIVEICRQWLYITEHQVNHNHVLTEACSETAFWPSQRHIDMFIKDFVKQLRDNNINIGKV
jgi:hypothetical protein